MKIDSRHRSDRTRRPHGPAFSLIEVIVVLGVIAVLIALALPALSRSRSTADDAAALAMQRHLLMSIHLYAADHEDALPYLGVPGDPHATFTLHGWTDRLGMLYFSQNKAYWLSLVYNIYIEPFPGARYDRDEAFPFFSSLFTPPLRPNPMVRSPFHLTHASAAEARFWDGDADRSDRNDLKGTRLAQVAHASRKGLILDLSSGVFASVRGASAHAASVGFADGSAAWKSWPPGGLADFDPNLVADRHALGAIPWPVMSTRRGLSGIDY